MSLPISDRLEGNPEALAVRERYRDIVDALGKETGRFVARFEVKIVGNGECVLLVTSSKGEEYDIGLCQMAVAVMQSLSGAKVGEPTPNESVSEEPK